MPIQRFEVAAPAAPGLNGTVTLYDDEGDRAQNTSKARLRMQIFSNVGFTIKRYWAQNKTAPLRIRSSTAFAATIAAVFATRTLTVVAKASLVDNDYFTVTDGTTTVIFEYKVTEDFVATAGRATIDVSAVTTDVQVAVATAAAINAQTTLKITCPVPSTAAITCTSDVSGTGYTVGITESVANAGFVVGALTAGVDGDLYYENTSLRPGRNKVTLTVTTAPAEFEVATEVIDDATTEA